MNWSKKKWVQTILYLVFLVVGIILFINVIKGFDFRVLLNTDLRWIFAVIVLSIIGHIIRALRWQLILKGANERVSIKAIFHSLLFGYCTSILIPRVGEITRCISLQKTSKIPATKIFGTVLVERIIDIGSLAIVLPSIFYLQYDHFKPLIHEYVYPLLVNIYNKITDHPLLVTIGIITIIIGLFIADRTMQKRQKQSEQKWLDHIWEGISSIKETKHLPTILLYSLLIWGYYFTTNYLCLFSLPSNLNEKWSAALATGAFGSIGRSLPIAGGGMGAYHEIIKQVLLLYGVSSVFATSMSIIFHGVQLLFHLIIGGTSGLWIYFKKEKIQEINN